MQFRLRTLLILLAVFCAVLAVWAERARRQQATVATLREIGVHVSYAIERDKVNFSEVPRSPIPTDYLYSVTVVRLWRDNAMQALPMLKRLPQLRELQFGYGYLGDDEIVKTLERELPRVKVTTFMATVG